PARAAAVGGVGGVGGGGGRPAPRARRGGGGGGSAPRAVIGPVPAVAGCGATASSPAIASTPASRAVITRRQEVLSSMIPSLLMATLGGDDGRVRERVVGGVRDPGVGAECGRTGHMGVDGHGDRAQIAPSPIDAD